jgi:hypothetical protein
MSDENVCTRMNWVGISEAALGKKIWEVTLESFLRPILS